MRYPLYVVVALALVWSGIAIAGNSSVFGSASKGGVYFSKRCAMCHGQDGRGNNGKAPDFVVEWNRLTKSDEVLAAHIRNQYKDSDSQTYYTTGKCPRHPTIKDEDMEDILAFLRRLAERNNHGGALDESDAYFDKKFDDFDRKTDDFDKQFNDMDKQFDDFR